LVYKASIPKRPTAAPRPAPIVNLDAPPVNAGLSGVVDELPLGLRITALPVALMVGATAVLFFALVGYGVALLELSRPALEISRTALELSGTALELTA
jgi:hypothetical protein